MQNQVPPNLVKNVLPGISANQISGQLSTQLLASQMLSAGAGLSTSCSVTQAQKTQNLTMPSFHSSQPSVTDSKLNPCVQSFTPNLNVPKDFSFGSKLENSKPVSMPPGFGTGENASTTQRSRSSSVRRESDSSAISDKESVKRESSKSSKESVRSSPIFSDLESDKGTRSRGESVDSSTRSRRESLHSEDGYTSNRDPTRRSSQGNTDWWNETSRETSRVPPARTGTPQLTNSFDGKCFVNFF